MKKKLLLILVSFLTGNFIFNFQNVFAQNNTKTYTSNGQISFFSQGGSSGGGGTSVLPKTGDQNYIFIFGFLIGICLILLVLLLILLYKKNKPNKNKKNILSIFLAIIFTLSISSQFVAFADITDSNQTTADLSCIENTDPVSPVDPVNPNPDNPVYPLDPTNPDNKPSPSTDGPLSINFASSLSFGENKIENQNATYYARAQELSDGRFVPAYVQITDNRGTAAGWTLTVSQKGQFYNANTKNKELIGAQINFTNPSVAGVFKGALAPTSASAISLDPNGAQSLVMSAKASQGEGTWINSWGKAEKLTDAKGNTVYKDTSIGITVPGTTPKDTVEYRTQFLWTLSDAPGGG